MKPIKLAIVRARYTAFGGAEQFVARIMQSLRSGGARVTIVTRKWQVRDTADSIVCDPFYVGSLWRDWGFARAVCNALKKERFDVVQSHERIACCDVYRAGDGVHREWLRQRSRALSVLGRLRLGLNPYHRYVKAAERRLFQNPQLRIVICNSHMVKAEIVQWFGVPAQKLQVIYSGVDTDRFSPALRQQHLPDTRAALAVPPDATLFLFVGSGFERKGLGQAIRALAQLPSSAYLAVVGKDKHERAFQHLAERHGVSERLRFLGGVAEVTPYYGAADVLVLPTLYDPFPNVILEAMAAGVPVITSYKSGGAELIEHGVNGWTCDALDVTALLSAMHAALAPGRLEAMRRPARARVEALTLDAMAQQYLRLYQDLLGESQSGP